jgi:hypothetical protein
LAFLKKKLASGVDVIIPIFGDFDLFSEYKLAFFLKTNLMMQFLKKLAAL